MKKFFIVGTSPYKFKSSTCQLRGSPLFIKLQPGFATSSLQNVCLVPFIDKNMGFVRLVGEVFS